MTCPKFLASNPKLFVDGTFFSIIHDTNLLNDDLRKSNEYAFQW